MKRLFLATAMAFAALSQANAQSVILTWTPPTTRVDGSALAPTQIGAVTIYDSASGTPVAIGTVTGAVGTFQTPQLTPGSSHSYTVVTCDTQSPPVCSAPSNTFAYMVPTPPLAAPAAVTDLTGMPGQ